MAETNVAGHLAVAVAAGALATKKENCGAAIKDRFGSLKRAIARRSDKIAVDADREQLAKELAEHGATKDHKIVETAKELLGLIKVDEAARDAVEPIIGDVEKALGALSELELEPDAKKAEASERTRAKVPVPAPSTSRRFLPPDEPSKTELERTALPIWQRTDRFFLKAGIVIASYVVIFGIWFFFIRVHPNEALDHCKDGEAARCWEVIAQQDTQEQGRKVEKEPLQILCDQHDPCGCAGLAYLKAADPESTPDCVSIQQASSVDPTWPCTCARYNFWRYGKQRTNACGIPKCE